MAQSSLLKTTSITNLDATPIIRANPWIHGANARQYIGTLETITADDTGSRYRFWRIGSWMRPVAVSIFCDAMTAGAVDVGLYRTAADGGAVVDADFFGSAVSLATALNGTDITYEQASTGEDISKAEQRIWEVLGLTVDPNLEYDVVASVTTAITAGGTLTLRGAFVV
jgi:hypothetical protein